MWISFSFLIRSTPLHTGFSSSGSVPVEQTGFCTFQAQPPQLVGYRNPCQLLLPLFQSTAGRVTPHVKQTSPANRKDQMLHFKSTFFLFFEFSGNPFKCIFMVMRPLAAGLCGAMRHRSRLSLLFHRYCQSTTLTTHLWSNRDP